MFGQNRYDRPGKGIDPNAPAKTGAALFWDVIAREFWGLLWLNLLFLLHCLPIVTIGASYSAMQSVLVRMLRDKPGDVGPDFRRGFKANWKQSTLFTVIGVVYTGILVVAYYFYQSMFPLFSYVMLWFSVMGFSVALYLYPLLVSVELSSKHLLKNSFFLGIIGLKQVVILLISYLLIAFFAVLLFPFSALCALLFGPVALAYLNCFFTYPVIIAYVVEQKTEA